MYIYICIIYIYIISKVQNNKLHTTSISRARCADLSCNK